MSAAKNTTKATEAMPAYHDADCNVMHATEAELRAAQAAKWTDQYVAFDHYANGECCRVVGLCVECRSIPRMEPDEIPDFAVVAQSTRDPDRRVEVNLVANRCEFYGSQFDALRDGLLCLGKGGAK